MIEKSVMMAVAGQSGRRRTAMLQRSTKIHVRELRIPHNGDLFRQNLISGDFRLLFCTAHFALAKKRHHNDVEKLTTKAFGSHICYRNDGDNMSSSTMNHTLIRGTVFLRRGGIL